MLLRRHNERSQPSQRTDSAHCFPASSRTVEAIEWRVASWQLGVCSCHLISASWGSCVPGLQEWIEFADWLQVILVALVLKVRINMQHFSQSHRRGKECPTGWEQQLPWKLFRTLWPRPADRNRLA